MLYGVILSALSWIVLYLMIVISIVDYVNENKLLFSKY